MKQIKNYKPGIFLLILFIILSLFTFKDYGISWDEPLQREMGMVSYDYITKGDHRLDTYIERDHGSGFEVVLIFIEKKLGLEDSRDIYLMRHLTSHLFFLIGCFFGYILCYRLFRNNVIACIGFLLLVFHPRIFAHSFLNTKDMPFFAMFLVSLALCQIAFDKNKRYWYLLAGIACGYATSIRVLGVMLVCIILSLLLFDMLVAFYRKEKMRAGVLNPLLFISGFFVSLYVTFPTLWASPVSSFIEVFKSLSHFRWVGIVLFGGEAISADALPWTYIPVWFCITTPVLWLFVGFTAVIWVIIDVIRSPKAFIYNTRSRNFIIYIACFILPVLAIILMKSVVYDDWRHLYFIYPSFVLLILYVVDKLYKSKYKLIVLSLFGLQFAGVGYFMIKHHPHQQVYFNRLVPQEPEYLRYHYDQDYWGCSIKQGLEYILKNDTSKNIKVYCPTGDILVENNVLVLPPDQRKRIEPTGGAGINYVVTCFRDHPGDFDYENVVYEIKIANSTVMRVYKR